MKSKDLNNSKSLKNKRSKIMNEKQIILTVGFGALGFLATGELVGGIVGIIVGYLLASKK